MFTYCAVFVNADLVNADLVNALSITHAVAMKLDQDRIVEAGLAILDRDGLEDLNMRAIARELGVGASALYRHVANKTELVSLMADSFYKRAFTAAPNGEDWRLWLLTFGAGFRTALATHRDSALLCARARPVSTDAQTAGDWLAGPLVEAGLDRPLALSYLGSVISLTLGWTIYEQSSALHDLLATMMDFDESFETGLASLVRGYPVH